MLPKTAIFGKFGEFLHVLTIFWTLNKKNKSPIFTVHVAICYFWGNHLRFLNQSSWQPWLETCIVPRSQDWKVRRDIEEVAATVKLHKQTNGALFGNPHPLTFLSLSLLNSSCCYSRVKKVHFPQAKVENGKIPNCFQLLFITFSAEGDARAPVQKELRILCTHL